MKRPYTFAGAPHARCRHKQSQGVALVLTLLLVAMLTVLVVGFNATTRTEQMAARNYVYQVVADEMAKSATQEAISTLQSALEGGVAVGFVTAPGRLTPLRGSAPVSLFSSNTTKIATPQSTDTEFGTWVAGSPLVKPGFRDIITTVGNSNSTNGRYAFFVDDETTKISLNSASSGRSPSSTNAFMRPFDIRVVPPLANAAAALAGYASGKAVTAPSFFFMPRQARSLNAGATDEQWNLWIPNLTTIQDSRLDATFAVNSSEYVNRFWNRTPWGSERIAINEVPVTTAGVQQVANALTNSRLNALFSTTNGAPRGFGTKYPSLVPQIAANMLMLRTPWWSPNYFTNPQTKNFQPPQNAPTPLGAPTEQYNVAGYPLPSGGPNANTAGRLKKTHGLPTSYFGAVPFPMLTEISPSVVYGWVAPGRMTVRVVLELEFFNPYPIAYDQNQGTAVIVAQIDKARFMVNYTKNPNAQWRGPDGTGVKTAPHNDMPKNVSLGATQVWDPWGAGDPNGLDAGAGRLLDPANGIKQWPVPSVKAESYATEFVYFDVSFNESNDTAYLASPVYCIIDSIKILRSAADSSSILDWVSGNDFFNALAASQAGPAQFVIPIDPTPIFGSKRGGNPTSGGASLDLHLPNSLPPPKPALSMAKRDPRMRTPVEASAQWRNTPQPAWAWIGNQPTSLLAPNTGFLPVSFVQNALPADQDYPSDAMLAAFAKVGGLFPGLLPNGKYEKAEHLGRVLTGAPWRSLSLQAQTSDELTPGQRSPAIPDWVVLDVFALSSPAVAPAVNASPVNPNAMGSSAGGQFQATDRVATTMRSLAKPMLALDTNQLSAIANNIAKQTWSSKFATNSPNQWSKTRGAFGFSSESIVMPSEIAEISTVADHSSKLLSTNETRLSAFYPLISTASRFFGIYARGEAVSGTNIMSVRQLKTTVEALIDPDSGKVKLETLFTEPVLE